MSDHILVSSLIALWGCLMASLWPMAWRLHLSIEKLNLKTARPVLVPFPRLPVPAHKPRMGAH